MPPPPIPLPRVRERGNDGEEGEDECARVRRGDDHSRFPSTVMVEHARAMRKQPTEAEGKLWEALRDHQCNGLHFRRQRPVGHFVIDFYCESLRLALEVDGGVHDLLRQREYDVWRSEELASRGIRLLRFRNEEVLFQSENVLRAIREAARNSPLPRRGEGLGVGAIGEGSPLAGGDGLGVGAIGSSLEIFVIDNHSCDDSIGVIRNRLRHFPFVHIFESPRNVGYARGNTLALPCAQGKYFLVINPDNTLEPTGLERMVALMEQDPTISILAPKLLHEDGTVRDSYRTFPSVIDLLIKRTILRHVFPGRMRRYLQWDQDPRMVRDVDWVVGACLLVRRELLEQIGSFDPRFFLFFEDIDLCRRAWEEGKRVVYFPEVTANDRKHRLSDGGLLSLLFHRTGRAHIRSALQYFWKWRGHPLPRRP